jgi:putative flippase GtrA
MPGVTVPAPAIEGGRLAAVLRHSLPRYLLVGGISAAIDLGLLYVLHAVLDVRLGLATFIAVAAAFVVNFTLNRVWSFGSSAPMGRQAVRYLILAGANWVLTVVLELVFTGHLGLEFMVAKIVILVINAAINYVGYRWWVFAS